MRFHRRVRRQNCILSHFKLPALVLSLKYIIVLLFPSFLWTEVFRIGEVCQISNKQLIAMNNVIS